MKIRFRQSGGFAGLSKGYELDTTTSSAEEAKEIESLVTASHLGNASAPVSVEGRDLYQYEISIEQDGTTTSATFGDSNVPQEALSLLRFLKQKAKPRPID